MTKLRLAAALFPVFVCALGCATTTPPSRPAVSVKVTDIRTAEVPHRRPGAVATWTTHGFLVVPSVEEGEEEARRAMLYSPKTGTWQRVPGVVPVSGPAFDAAHPLGAGGVVFAGSSGWRVDPENGTWTPLEGGPMGHMLVSGHVVRPGAVFVHGREETACAAWELSEAGWARLPSPPCAEYEWVASDGQRWWMFQDVDGELKAASLAAGDTEWRPLLSAGAPDAFGAPIAGDGWIVMHGSQTFPFLWVNAEWKRGLFVLREGRWSMIDADDETCGAKLVELRGDVLVSAPGEGRLGCAWDLRSGRRVHEFAGPSFDEYIPGEGMTFGWGTTFRPEPGPTNPSPRPVHSNAAALIEWRVKQ